MLNKYYVLVLSINKTGGNSEDIIRKNNLVEAENTFFDKCSQYGGNASTGYVVVQVLDPYGRVLMSQTINRLPEPEPETETEGA